MPKRTDLKSILIIGAGPIVIGQACEFDYSGTQACKALREEGYRVVLVNSNPATIMTDPEFADRTYIEPITPECVEKIIAREVEEMRKMGISAGKSAAHKLVLLPTLGGQTALNTAMALNKRGTLEKYDVEMIGAKPAEIAVVYSASSGINAVASALNYRERPKIVMADFDFPTVGHVWLAQQQAGARVEFVWSHDGSVNIEDYERLIDNQTAVVSITLQKPSSPPIQGLMG